MTANPPLHALTASECEREAEPILKRVFPEGWPINDGFGELFAPQITARMILYPCLQGGIVDCLSMQVLVDEVQLTGKL